MVNVDRVYQKVLALANKEQRGYITPQDFNLFANQAQMEIFEQYFYDVNIARKGQGNDTVYADVDDMLEEKLQIFEKTEDASTYAAGVSTPASILLPNYIYRVNKVFHLQANKLITCEILNTKDFNEARYGGYLTRPTRSRPIANIHANELLVAIEHDSITNIGVRITFFKVPAKVNWAYIVMNNKAMYNEGGGDVHFQLHRSEETNLVNKILKLAGISIKQQDVAQSGQGMEASTIQQQPKI